jgi:hypothetical protein
MNIWMVRVKQRMTVKNWFLKGRGCKLIHKELIGALRDNAISRALTQEIQIRRSFLRWRRTAWKTPDFIGPDSSALSQEVSCCEFSSNGRTFLDGPGYHQDHSWSGIGGERIHSQMDAHILSAGEKMKRVVESQSLLTILANLAEKRFQGIIRRSWRNSQSDSGSREALHFRKLSNCFQVVDGVTNLRDCKQWEVMSLEKSLVKWFPLRTLRSTRGSRTFWPPYNHTKNS